MKVITAPALLSDHETACLGGKHLGEDDYTLLITGEDATILKPDGSPLVIYQANVLPGSLCETAYSVFSRVEVGSQNRGMAAGEIDPGEREVNGLTISHRTSTRFRPMKKDGTESKTTYARKVPSAVVGFLDAADSRNPYCRQTVFSLDHPDEFARARPFIREVDRVFAEAQPDRHAAQAGIVAMTSPDFVIRNTAFTTITVNHNFQTAVHQDKNDLKEGFGVMAVLDAGEYAGGYLVFPKYGVAVDMRAGGVCLADVHEWHGNTPIVGRPGRFKRVSLVFYYRERMGECGSKREEEERAKLSAERL